MFRISELRKLKNKLLLSYQLRELPNRDCLLLYRFLTLERNTPLKEKIVLSLVKRFLWKLPNLIEEREFLPFRMVGVELSREGMDHKEICEKSSWTFAKSSSIYGKGLFSLSDDLHKVAESLKKFLFFELQKYNLHFVTCPTLVTRQMLLVTGQLPKFELELFRVSDRYFLSPTGEVQLGNLPVKRELILGTLSRCYRREKGYGKTHKGLIRNLEFEKLEIFGYSLPKNSWNRFSLAVLIAVSVVRKLGFVYRIIELPPREISFSAVKTLDIEIWLPISKIWMEISSISNCSDFQSRRAGLKWGKIFPHTFNASCLPIGRTLTALSEYWQTPEGIIDIVSLELHLEKLKGNS